MGKDVQETLLKQLKNPFDPKFVKWRVGATNKDKTKGIALAYIDSREVTKRLDEVLGIGNWRDKLTEVISERGGFISEIEIKVDGEWISRSDAAGNTNVEPIKGGASGAFKRAAAKWGVGRYLYYLPNIWVPIVPQGNSYVLAEIPTLPKWALPGEVENWEDVAELEVDVSATMDEQQVEGIVTNALNIAEGIRGAQSREELDRVVKKMSSDEQRIFADIIVNRTEELLGGEANSEPNPDQPKS